MKILYESGTHRNIFFNDLAIGQMVQANQHLIIDGNEAMILDPGGHKIQTMLFSEISKLIPISGLKHIFFSHQDPDIIASANVWLMLTDAQAYLSALWMRFIPYFGVDELVVNRITPLPDEGATVYLGGKPLKLIPAHFLHSPGNFQVYDPVAKILYSGDLGASLGNNYDRVEDFDAHIPYLEPFHRRYITTAKPLKMWARMARTLDIEMIAPQHGAMFPNREMSRRFIDWVETVSCGVDLMGDTFIVPA